MKILNRYRIWCNTDSKFEYIWAEIAPTTCPINISHSVNLSTVSIVEILSDVQKVTTNNVLRVSTESPEGTRITFTTPNWGDRTTWYYKSTKKTGITLTDSGDGLTFTINAQGNPVYVIDNFHGKYSDEDYLTTAEGDIPRAQIYDMGLEKTEKDPHTDIGDLVVDYKTGSVIFETEPSGVVTMDYWEPGSSEFIIKPPSGKKIKINRIDAQFDQGLSIQDTIVFRVCGLADAFAPHLVPSPLPSGTMIDLANPRLYKTMHNFINRATSVMQYNSIATDPTWRDIVNNIHTYSWDYLVATDLDSSTGMEISIKLEHDVEFSGFATTTLYGLYYNE